MRRRGRGCLTPKAACRSSCMPGACRRSRTATRRIASERRGSPGRPLRWGARPPGPGAGGRPDNLTKPQGSLGRLEDVAAWLAGVQGKELPSVKLRTLFVAAADHGVAAREVSAYPSEVTAQMVENFLAGGAAINVLARQANAEVIVIDAGV